MPGQLIIKVSDELVANIENNDINSREEAGATVNIRNMERLFPHAGRFEERTRAAGLHKWYVVSYDESIKTKAATSGLSIPGVEIIEVPAQIERIGSGSISVQEKRSSSMTLSSRTSGITSMTDLPIHLSADATST